MSGAEPPEDRTGRDRMVSNVVSSWAGHLVFVVAGFILPRMIDDHLGQTDLGIWDFGWSIVSYFSLFGAGVGSSVNRYVARHRAVGDTLSLARSVSSVVGFQLVAAAATIVAAVLLSWRLPIWFGDRVGTDPHTAQWVVLLLGLGLSVEMAFDPFRGVVTGCHRWDLHNGISSGVYALTATGMVVALVAGAGLISLAALNLAGTILTGSARVVAAFRVCPELRIGLEHASLGETRRLVAFGLKSLVASIAHVLLGQGISLIIVGNLGASALAVIARPWGLGRQIETLVAKFSFVLTPTASSLQRSGSAVDIRALLQDSSRNAAYLTLPMLVVLGLVGDDIIEIWMGREYRVGVVLQIIAFSGVLPISQRTVLPILTGLNLHGRAAFLSLVFAVLGLLMGLVTIWQLQWGLVGAALSVGLPVAVSAGVVIPAFACRRLGVSVRQYFWHTYALPVACVLPLAACLLAARRMFPGQPFTTVAVGGGIGGAVLALIYWRLFLRQLLERYPALRMLTRNLGGLLDG